MLLVRVSSLNTVARVCVCVCVRTTEIETKRRRFIFSTKSPTFGNLGGHASGGGREARVHSLGGEDGRLALLHGLALLGPEAGGGRHEGRSKERGRHGVLGCGGGDEK